MKSIEIGDEIIREIVHCEQYTIRPKNGFFEDDCGDPYEIVIFHNGEEWVINARTFPRNNEVRTEKVLSPQQYFDMLPCIRTRFGFDVED